MQKKEKKLDRRVRRTRKSLGDALIALIHEKAYPDITIHDITEKADLNRATFYLHYGTKEELLTTSLETKFDELVAKFELEEPYSEQNPIWEDNAADVKVFEHVAENAALYKIILGEHGMGYIINRIITYIAMYGAFSVMKSLPKGAKTDPPIEISSWFYAGSLYSLIVWWLNNDMPYSAQEMAGMAHKLQNYGCIPEIISELPST